MYKPVTLSSQLILGEGFPVVITGWTVAKSVANKLNPTDYAVIGQLFSAANGLSPLMRNILANKGYTTLIMMAATQQDKNAGSVKCLRDFFQYGFYEGATDTGHPCWVVDSDVPGFIDREIPKRALDWVRNNVKALFVTSIKELLDECQKNYSTVVLDVEPEIFPAAKPPTCPMFPGPLCGHVVRGTTVAETWLDILNRIRTTGAVRKNGWGGQWQELLDLVAVVESEPRGYYFPEPNYLPISRDFLATYIGQVLDDAPVAEGVKYTYGQRLRSSFGVDQVEQVIKKLGDEPDSASAVMNLWDVRDHERGGSPCLNHIWVRVNGQQLTLTATFRSNDMFSAWPANAMGLRALQWHIVDEVNARYDLGLEAGELITVSQSAHIYDHCFSTCDEMRVRRKRKREYKDPAGNFIITLGRGTVCARWTTPSTGATVKVYEGERALEILRSITEDAPYLEASHAAYLGFELARAESALRLEAEYRQDAP